MTVVQDDPRPGSRVAAWRARLRALRAPAVELAWRDGWLSSRGEGGWRPEAPATDLEALRGALAGVLASCAHRRLRLRVGDEHGRLLRVPRPEGARTPRELEAAWQARFEQLFGEDAAAWSLHADAAPRAGEDLVCAWPVALVETVREACARARVRWVSMRMEWAVAAASAPRRGSGWVLSIGERSLVLGWHEDDRVRGVRRLPMPMDGDDLAAVLARATPLFADVDPGVAAAAPVRIAGRTGRLARGALAGRVIELVDAEAGRGADRLRGLDAAAPRPRGAAIAWVAAGVLALSVAGPRWLDARAALGRAEAARDARAAAAWAARPAPVARAPLSHEQAEAVDAAIASLDRPWPALMRAIDAERPADVEVVAMQPGEPATRLRLTIESARAPALAEFVSRLAAHPPVRAVSLRREERTEGASPRHRLEMDLDWGGS